MKRFTNFISNCKKAFRPRGAAKFLFFVLLLIAPALRIGATAWTTSIAGAVNNLSNWSDGSISPTSFATPGDTWTINLSMTLPASAIWTLGTSSASPVTVTFATGGTVSMSGAGSTFTINIHGNLEMNGGTLNLGGAGTTANVTVNGNANMVTGAVNSIASSTILNIRVNGLFSMSGGSVATSGASSVINWNTNGNFTTTGGSFVGGGAGSTLRHNVRGNGSLSGTFAMTNVGAGCTTRLHFALPSISGTMLIDNTSTGTWSGTNVYIDTGCTAQLAGNFSTTTGSAAFGLTTDGTLICPAAYVVNGTRVFRLNGLGTLVTAHATGVNGAIVTTGTTTFSNSANYTFNGSTAQVTGTNLPVSLVAPSVLTINNSAGVTLTSSVSTTGTLAFTTGILNTGVNTITTAGAATAVTGAGLTGYVNGTLIKSIAGLTSINYEVGDVNYAPMSLTFDAAGTSGRLGLKVTNGLHPSVATSGLFTTSMANHYWTISAFSPTGPSTVAPTGTYNAADIIGGSNATFKTQVYNGSAWLGAPLSSTNTSSPYTSTPVAALPIASIAGDYIFGDNCGVAPITGTLAVCAGSTTTLADATPGGVWSTSAPGVATVSASGVVNGLAPGTAIIYYTTTCPVSAVVTVYTFPTAGAVSGTGTLCVGATTTLTTTGTGGTWSSGSPAIATVSAAGVVSGLASGTATISYTVTNVCGTAFATYIVTVNAVPVVAPIAGVGPVCLGGTMPLSDVTPGGVWSSTTPAVATISGTGVVSSVTTGTTTISYTVTNTCGTSAAFVVVTVSTVPSVSPITGTPTVCIGATQPLASASPGGLWSSSAPTVVGVSAAGLLAGMAAGTGTIFYSITNTCGTVSTSIVATVTGTPSVPSIAGIDSLCPGDTVILTNALSGGVWSSTNTAIATVSATGEVIGIAPGLDTIIYTFTNDCGTDAKKLRIKVRSNTACGTSVASIEKGEHGALEVFPNPNSGSFTVALSATENDEALIMITDVTGRQVQAFATTTNRKTTVTLNQPAGMYFVSATTTKGRYVVKVSVQ